MDFSQHLRIVLHCRDDVRHFDEEVISRLDEAGAFAGRPAVRFIVSTAVKNGAFTRFASAGEWNAVSLGEIERFIAHTGFSDVLANGVFDAYGEAMGWGRRQSVGADVSVPGPLAAFVGTEQPAYCALNSDCSILDAYNRVLEVDREKEAARGVAVELPAAIEATDRAIRLTATLRRLRPMASAALMCTVSTGGGIVAETACVAVMTVTSPSVFPVSFMIPRIGGVPAAVTLCIV